MYMANWHRVDVAVHLRDRSDAVLWEARFDGSESNVLWLGLEAEFAQTVKEALDKALIRAIEEFRSDAFAAKVDAAAQASTPTVSPAAAASEGEASAR